MGKKRVIKKTADELIKEKESVDKKMQKEVKVKAAGRARRGRVYISSSYNNTLISLADEKGNVLLNRSAGSIGFKGTKKGTSFAGSKVAEAAVLACQKMRISQVDVFVKGIGGGRDSALKTLANKGLDILSIADITPLPHNGCRPRKVRRV